MANSKKQVHRVSKAVEGQNIRCLVFLLVLVWTYCAFGATKYVATDGNDADTGDIDDPWLTIEYAISQIGDGDTIKVAAGTYKETGSNQITIDRAITATIESQSGDNDVWVKPNGTSQIIQVTAAGTFTFNNINFMPLGATCSRLFDPGTIDNYSVTFDTCQFDMNGVAGSICDTGDGTGQSLTFTDCTITADNVTSNAAFVIYNFTLFELNGCTITQDGSSLAVVKWISGYSGTTMKIVDCTINNVTGSLIIHLGAAGATDAIEHLIVTGNTITEGRLIHIVDEDVRFVNISNNTITSTGVGTVFNIGLDSGTGTNTLSGFVVKNNTITKDAFSGHCILLGTNCEGAEVSHNTFISTDTGDWGFVIKGNYNNAHHNFIKSSNCAYLYGAQYNKVQYNSCYTIGGCTCYWATSGTTTSKGNIITNNIFDGSGGADYAICDSDDGHCDNYIDYNCYVAGSRGVAKLDGTKHSTISALQAKWATWSDVWPLNDAHSIIADPQFLDTASGDFRLKPGSPCLNAGEPTAANGYTDIGAWQAIGRSKLLLPNCTRSLEMDFNGDCKIDFQDFALFSLGWLECNLDPPELCWE